MDVCRGKSWSVGVFCLMTVFGCSEPPDVDLLALVDGSGLDSAVEAYRMMKDEEPDGLDMEFLRSLSVTLAEKGNDDAALAFLRLNLEAYPDSVQTHTDLAKLHLALNHKDSSRVHISNAEQLDPLRLSTLMLRKRIFFVPVDFEAQTEFITEQFYIRPISGADAELDYPAVMSSIDHIKKILGSRSWPTEELTLEEDRKDLARHEGEMVRGEAFVYTVMNPEQTEVLGCVYIFASRWDDYNAEISMWTTEQAFDEGLDELLFANVKEWIANEWPFEKVVYFGRDVSFREFYEKLGAQDEKYH